MCRRRYLELHREILLGNGVLGPARARNTPVLLCHSPAEKNWAVLLVEIPDPLDDFGAELLQETLDGPCSGISESANSVCESPLISLSAGYTRQICATHGPQSAW